MNTRSAAGQPSDWGVFNATGNPTPASVVNTMRINAVTDRLLQPGSQIDNQDFRKLCFSLSRGIDYALANGETPNKSQVLPELMKQVRGLLYFSMQICQQSHDEYSRAALMVLMISVKNACKVGWFQTKESEELLTIADKMGKIYCSMDNLNAGPSSCHSTITTIMERFYPTMTLGPILASVEAKPGYGAFVVDFIIAKSEHLQDKIHLLVAQTDNIETSACLISPQQANFLLNGKGVEKRTNVQMDSGPQMPTNVNGMLKYGTNLLQAVGQFNGNYVILVAYMSATSLLEHPVLQDYVHPAVTSIDSDSDIIEGPSQISLNCPISFTRIKTPVKGRSCKHFQCFDFDNFININSRRPSWRCPHCNQYVCYADIGLDQNMVEVLKNVGEDIVEVIVLGNGSWRAVSENDRDVDKIQNKGRICEKEQTEPQESTCSPSTVPNVLDLTNDDDHFEIMDTCETADRKPFLGMNCTGVNQSVAQIEDEFWSGVLLASGSSDTPAVGASERPVQPDTVSPAFHPEAEGHDNNLAVDSAVHNQYSALNNILQLNMNSIINEYGRSSSVPRHINRTPVAVQALPVQSQALRPQQNSVTNLCSLLPSSSSATPHISLSNPASADGLNAILSDTERQQHFSRSPMNVPQVSGVNSSTLQHHSATQNRVPAASQLQNQYRASGLFTDYRNPHLRQALNPRSAQPMRSSNTPRSHIQQRSSQAGIVQAAGATTNSQQARVMPAAQAARQGSSQAGNFQEAGATANSQQARGMAAAQVARQSPSVSVQNQASVAATPFTADTFRGLTGEQRGNLGGTVQSVSRADELINLQSEQNWRPTQRMRGSLSGRQFSDDVRQRIIAPTQPVRSSNSRPQGPQLVRPTSVSPQLDVLIANNRNAHNSSST